MQVWAIDVLEGTEDDGQLQLCVPLVVLDGESYRKRQKPGLDVGSTAPRSRRRRRPTP